MSRVAYLVPAFNAEKTLATVLKGISVYSTDIVVVNDGSTDGTGGVAEAAGATVLTHAENRGKGAALKTGFDYLEKREIDWIMTVDADGQHSPEDIPRLIETCRQAEDQGHNWGMVIGSRFASRELIPAYRYYPNRVGQIFLTWLTGQKMEDTQSGFRVYRTDVLQRFDLDSKRFDMETEVILRVARLGYRILFAPIRTIYPEDERKKTNFRPFFDTYRIAVVVLKEIWNRMRSEKT